MDIKYGPECALCISKEKDGTINIIKMRERGGIEWEKRNMPEGEACDFCYDLLIRGKAMELAYQARLEKEKHSKIR